MQFISTKKQQSFTLEPKRKELRETNAGPFVVENPGKRVRFSPLTIPFKTALLVGNGGEAWGMLDSKIAADDAGIEEKELIDYLIGHSLHGVTFVGIGFDGKEVSSDEDHVQRSGERGYFCDVCETHIKNSQGMANHVKSEAHIEGVRALNVESLASVV